MKRIIRSIFNKVGIDIKKYPTINERRKICLLSKHEINLILDVGANIGQFGSETRKIGYKGKIVSFEPLSEAFEKLRSVSKSDDLWKVENIGLGDINKKLEINISGMSASSSFLEMKNDIISSTYTSANYIGKETIDVYRLDSIFKNYYNPQNSNVFLKIDAQGYEDKILNGAIESLKYIKGIQLEMSLIELYKGEILFLQMLNKIYELGYELCNIEQGFYDPKSTELYQVDAIFYRK
jgi:FkbM family methyltransferase